MEDYQFIINTFKTELEALLRKYSAKLTINDSEIIDYKNVEGFGNIYKKVIHVEIGESIDFEL